MRRTALILSALIMLALTGCDKVDSTSRIPTYQVAIRLNSTGLWNTYGVHSYGESVRFSRDKGIPANYSYTATTYTGFGGVLLICGYNFVSGDYNSPLAYDLACPVEAKSSVIVSVNSDYEAVCPVCGSHFNVTEGGGGPISGPALTKKYGLQRYTVTAATNGGYVITN
jgi:hypothetical protein